MADRGGKTWGIGVKPVPMKLFATWEVEKSSPNCIPRLCSLTLTRLVIAKALENELTSVILAVKMQNSKRILRSNEIIMSPNGLLDTELELSFSLQYPHFLKRDGNKLQVLLQRRKKYKNRTILGYKTLAMGTVNMAQVLQRSVDRELSLYSDPKERNNKVAQVMVLSLSSQPVDHEENGRVKLRAGEVDRSPDVDMSDEEEVQDDQEFWSNDEMSDSEAVPEDDPRTRNRKSSRGPIRGAAMTRQRNLKQKFIALLKRFKMTEEVLDSEQDQELGDQDANPQEIEDLFDELEDLSDSGPEMDTISVLSTPKPKLRPFFTGRGSALDILDVPRDSGRQSDDSSKRNDSDSHLDNLTDQETYEMPTPRDLPRDIPPLRDNNMAAQGQVVLGSSPAGGSEPGSVPSTPPASSYSSTPYQTVPSQAHTGSHAGSYPASPQSPSLRARTPRSTSMREKKSTKREKLERRNSAGNAEALPRKVLLDQLSLVLSSDDSLPESFVLVNTNDWQGQLLAQILTEPHHKVIHTCSSADVKATISFIVTKIQKFCNSNSRSPSPIKIAIAGGDGYVNVVLRPYVEQFSAKSHDWQNYIKFLYIPLGASMLAKYVGSVDSTYYSLFQDSVWRDVFEKSDNPRPADMAEIINRISRYVNGANSCIQLPIAEAMITYREKSSDEESSQIFVPFINEVRIGPIEFLSGGTSSSVDLEDSMGIPPNTPNTLSSSPPQGSTCIEKIKDNHTPPSSPNVNMPSITSSFSSTSTPLSASSPPEFLDLQLDYWTILEGKPELGPRDRLVKKDSKSSLKTTFKCVQVYRLPPHPTADLSSSSMSMMVVTKEKKQKIMRIGKKSKGEEPKSQLVEGINRLICTSKSQSHPLTVTIDGVDWTSVKFFQLSSQWQTHIKHMPIMIFGPSDTPL